MPSQPETSTLPSPAGGRGAGGEGEPPSRWRQLLKLAHVATAAVTLGAVACMLLLILLKSEFAADEDLFLLDLAVFRLFESAATWGFAGLLLTGAAYSLLTDWGLWRWRWVTLKWLLSLALGLAAPLWLVPAVNGMAALGDAGQTQDARDYLHLTALAALYLSLAAAVLLGSTALSVFKPGGQHRRPLVLASTRLRAAAALALVAVAAALYGWQLHLQELRTVDIVDEDVSLLPDGSYQGEARCGGARYRVEVDIEGGELRALRVLERPDSFYAYLAERLVGRILDAQSPAVDAITGATTSSKCLLQAVERALGAPVGATI